MDDEADRRQPEAEQATERPRRHADLLTIALVAFFVALIVIVAVLLLLPLLNGAGPIDPRPAR